MKKETFPESPAGRLLRRVAGVDDDAESREAIRRACLDIEDWTGCVQQAEAHGLAPYLYERVKTSGVRLPVETRHQLQSLTLRHRASNRIRDRALGELIEALETGGIEVLVLKGAALAHLVYPQPGLRPMRDIDLLVPAAGLDDAADAVRALGYRGGAGGSMQRGHHHLPPLARTLDGLKVSVEIHHDAIAPDNTGSIRLDALTDSPRPFRLPGGTRARALGHIDMLRHLWRHALQPRAETKLGDALDIVLYASYFAADMDWQRIEREFPEILTGLRLLAYLVPPPRALAGRIPRIDAPPPCGVGIGMPPLAELRTQRGRLARTVHPSDWWLHGFYDVPPGRSLAVTRTFRHPARVIRWLWRRLA